MALQKATTLDYQRAYTTESMLVHRSVFERGEQMDRMMVEW